MRSEIAADQALPEDAGCVARHCWCGCKTARQAFHLNSPVGRSYTVVCCDGCAVLALHPQPSDDELLAAYSPEYYGVSRRKFIWPISSLVAWFQEHRARMAARLLPASGVSARVLDIGCGNGGFLAQMKRRGYEVEGTEWTHAGAARVPKELNVPVHVGDLLAVDLPERSYDMVTMWHVLEHVRQPHELLLKVARLLKPGGHLLLALPNAQSAQAMRFGPAWFHHDPPRHLFGFGPNSLRQLLELTGFEVAWVSTWSLEQNPFGQIQSWLNARGYPRDRLYTMLKGLSREPLSTKLVDLSWACILLGSSLAISAIESAAGHGATITLQAKLKNEI